MTSTGPPRYRMPGSPAWLVLSRSTDDAQRCCQSEAPASALHTQRFLNPAHRRRAEGALVVRDDAPDIAARREVFEGGGDVVEPVGPGHQLVELELPPPVHLNLAWDVAPRVALAEKGPLDALLPEGDLPRIDRDALVGVHVSDRRHYKCAALTDRRQPLGDVRSGEHTHRDDGRVGTLAVGDGLCELVRLADRREPMGGADLERDLALELDWVSGNHGCSAAVGGALNRADADSARAHYDDDVAWADVPGVDSRSPAGAHAAGEQTQPVERQLLADLDD